MPNKSELFQLIKNLQNESDKVNLSVKAQEFIQIIPLFEDNLNDLVDYVISRLEPFEINTQNLQIFGEIIKEFKKILSKKEGEEKVEKSIDDITRIILDQAEDYFVDGFETTKTQFAEVFTEARLRFLEAKEINCRAAQLGQTESSSCINIEKLKKLCQEEEDLGLKQLSLGSLTKKYAKHLNKDIIFQHDFIFFQILPLKINDKNIEKEIVGYFPYKECGSQINNYLDTGNIDRQSRELLDFILKHPASKNLFPLALEHKKFREKFYAQEATEENLDNIFKLFRGLEPEQALYFTKDFLRTLNHPTARNFKIAHALYLATSSNNREFLPYSIKEYGFADWVNNFDYSAKYDFFEMLNLIRNNKIVVLSIGGTRIADDLTNKLETNLSQNFFAKLAQQDDALSEENIEIVNVYLLACKRPNGEHINAKHIFISAFEKWLENLNDLAKRNVTPEQFNEICYIAESIQRDDIVHLSSEELLGKIYKIFSYDIITDSSKTGEGAIHNLFSRLSLDSKQVAKTIDPFLLPSPQEPISITIFSGLLESIEKGISKPEEPQENLRAAANFIQELKRGFLSNLKLEGFREKIEGVIAAIEKTVCPMQEERPNPESAPMAVESLAKRAAGMGRSDSGDE